MSETAMQMVQELEHNYVRCIDEDQLERWPGMFTDSGRYEVLSSENVRNGLELPIISCDSKAMMEDRVLSLRKTTIFNLHADRHIISNILIREEGPESYNATLNFALFQTDTEGRSKLFLVGSYDDIVVIDQGEARFLRKRVILDSFSVPNMISTPV